MNATVLEAPPETESQTPQGDRRWPRRLLCLGIALAAGVRVHAFGIDLGAALGGLLVVWACWRLRLAGVAWLALAWTALEGAEGYLPQHAALDLLGSGIGLVGFLLICRAGVERCGSAAERSSRAWRQAGWVGGVAWGSMLGVGIVLAVVGALSGPLPGWVSHSLLLLIGLSLVTAAPIVATCRAWALESVDTQQAGRLARLLTRPVGAALVAALLLTPIWLLLPSWIHFARTPTFATYLETAAGGAAQLPLLPEEYRVVESLPTRRWGEGQPSLNEAKDPHTNTFSYTWTWEVFHGEQRLLELTQRLIRTESYPDGELQGVLVETLSDRHDPRFGVVVRSAVGEGLRRPHAKQGEFRVPLRIDVELASAAAPVASRHELVWVQGKPERAFPTWFLEESTPELSWTSIFIPPGPPPQTDGLRYSLRLEGELSLDASNGTAFTDARLKVNSEEYSYRFVLSETTVQQDAGSMKLTRTTRRNLGRQWNGEVW